MRETIVEARTKNIDGISDWFWIKDETGAWTGPAIDWASSHKEKFLQHVRKRDVVICAGGNQGMYPRLFAREFHYVFAFEPDPLNFYVMNLNCQEDHIIKIQAALGAKADSIALWRNSMINTGMHRVSGRGMIPQMALDNFFFPTVDLIQLDVEGYESDVLRGAEQTIVTHRPVITCENADKEIMSFLSRLGYVAIDQSVSDTIFIPA